MLEGFSSIDEVQGYWHIYEKDCLELSQQQGHHQLIEPLAKLYSYIVEYQARVVCHLSKVQLTRAWQDVTGWNDWAAKAAKVKDASDECSKYITLSEQKFIRACWNKQLHEMQQSRAILDEIPGLLAEIKQQDRVNYEDRNQGDLLEILASDYEDYKDFNEKKVDGTCEWFFHDDRFHKWRDAPSSSLLWMSAGPGCGKSVLSRALVDESRLSTNITTTTICYFFFKDGDQRRMHSTNALCGILHQLFTQDRTGDLIKNATISHKNYGKVLAQNFSELWKILLDCARSPGFGEVVCILDALDECEKKSADQLIDKLEQFYCGQHNLPTGSKLKFLITSRPYGDLETDFAEFSGAEFLRFDGSDKSAEIGREINLVIDHLMRKFAADIAADDRRRLSDRLKSMENRTYLWLYLIFNKVKENISSYKKSSSFEQLLRDIPSQVSDAYEKILSRSQNEEQTVKLLQIMLAAARPLTLREANIALTMAMQAQRLPSFEAVKLDLWPEDDFKSTVQNLCGLFISVRDDSQLYFIHQTAREFLVHSEKQGKWQGRFSIPESHGTMSLVCLDFLLLPDLTLTQLSLDDRGSLLSYSACYWTVHFTSQECGVASQSRKDARRLCDPAGEQAKLWIPGYFKQTGTRSDFSTELQLTSYLGLKLIIEDLIQEEIDINAQGGKYGTALVAASREGYSEVVQLFLDNGADVNAQGGDYGTALQAASMQYNSKVVQLFLDYGADINAEGGVCGRALLAASVFSTIKIVQLLLDNGAEVNAVAQSRLYGTALQAAARKGNIKVIQLLLDNGAEVNAIAQSGLYGTALQAAAREGHIEII